jgi:hypothetical protein
MSKITRSAKMVQMQFRTGRLPRLAMAILCSLFTVAVIAPRAFAQGCAMCYQNAAASGEQGRTALRHGILILLLPAISLFLGIFGLIYSRRRPSQR